MFDFGNFTQHHFKKVTHHFLVIGLNIKPLLIKIYLILNFIISIFLYILYFFTSPGCQWLSNSKMGGGGLELCSNRGGVRYPSHKWGRATVVPFHCYNRYHHNHNCYDKWCFVTNSARVACTYILGSAMLPVEKKPCQGRGWTYNHPQRSDQDRDPWNR